MARRSQRHARPSRITDPSAQTEKGRVCTMAATFAKARRFNGAFREFSNRRACRCRTGARHRLRTVRKTPAARRQPSARSPRLTTLSDAQGELIYQVCAMSRKDFRSAGRIRTTRRVDLESRRRQARTLPLPDMREAGADEIVFLPKAKKIVYLWPASDCAATTNQPRKQRIGGRITPRSCAAVTLWC